MGYENSGRRPKPTALHVLRGNPSRKILNENEPRPPAGEARKPEGLSPSAAVVWDELAPVCLQMGTLTVADVLAFASLCELQSTMRETSAAKAGAALFRPVVESVSSEVSVEIVIDAVLRLERETANALRPYYEYFGLTPPARARLVVPKGKGEPRSKWAGVK